MFSFQERQYANAEINSIQNQQLEIVYPRQEDLPKSAMGYAANNVYPGFPPLMADGRALIASWQPESVVNDQLRKTNNIQSNWEYRRYLTNNAEMIMRQNFVESANDVGYYERRDGASSASFVSIGDQTSITGKHASPFRVDSIMDPAQPLGYETTDLKQLYLSREQLDAQRVSPAITQAELIQRKQV
jgi:hypothetical protein